jgi:hypothetical protein
MAVWTQNAQVFKPIIGMISVNMIEFDGNGTVRPRFIPATENTLGSKNVFSEEAIFEFVALDE